MSLPVVKPKHAFAWLLLAGMMLCAQQAAQLHALSHAWNDLAQPGRAPSHPIEQCIAFHAIDSALTATAALYDFDFLNVEGASWFRAETSPLAVYRLPARAPPRIA